MLQYIHQFVAVCKQSYRSVKPAVAVSSAFVVPPPLSKHGKHDGLNQVDQKSSDGYLVMCNDFVEQVQQGTCFTILNFFVCVVVVFLDTTVVATIRLQAVLSAGGGRTVTVCN